MNTKLVFELTLKSDYHVGSGHNKGVTADSSLLREANGQPALRGSILGQMLKEAAIDMLKTEIMQGRYPFKCANAGGPKEPEYCGQWHKQGELCPICFIFGTPAQPRKWEFDSARLAEVELNRSISLPKDWGATSITRNRVSPRQRRTEPDKLFSEEVGDGRLKFYFEAKWIGEGEPEAATIAFLAAAARNWRYLGKSRRRGRGQCSVRLLSAEGFPADQDWMAEFKSTWLDKTWKDESLPRPKATHALSTELVAPDWQPLRIRVVARLDEPVLVAKRVLAGNQFASVDMIPGNVLLGALASRAVARNDLSATEHYAKFVSLFRRGGIRFNHLALASLNVRGQMPELFPAFAAPLDVFRCKEFPANHTKVQHPDRSFSLIPQDQFIVCDQCQEPDNNRESIKGLHILAAGKLEPFDHNTREEMHIRLNTKTQRVKPGILFEYVCLEAGQFLCSEIVCRNEQAWNSLCEMTEIEASGNPFKLKLGKGTRRGYGGVSVVFEMIREDQPESRPSLLSLRERLPDPKAEFRLYLNSDAIIRDPWGRFVANWQPDWLSTALNLEVSVKRGFAKTRYIDSFYNHLGLPRWRDRGLLAGSAVGVQIQEPSLSEKEIWERLEQVELQGIGLRRNEGFGQVIVNHPLYETLDDPGAKDINLKMTLPTAFSDKMEIAGNVVEKERTFKDDWHSEVEAHVKVNWASLAKEQFAPVARMLRAEKHLGLQHLMARLESLRKSHASSEEIISVLGEPLMKNPDKQPVLREPKDFFVKGDGKAGLNALIEFLRGLANKTLNPTELALIVGLLAEHVAKAVDDARQKESR